jgi:flagellar biosynthesis protein FlhB
MTEEKQFEPTQSRLEKAKREGDVARSQEIASVAAFAAGLVAATAVIAPVGSAAHAMLTSAANGRTDVAALGSVLLLTLVPAGAAACAACTANVVQSGGLRFTGISVKAQRLDPSENLKRMFSKESLVTAARGTTAFACGAAALVPAFIAIYGATLHAARLESIAAVAWNGALRAAFVACGVGGIFAAADYGVQLARWRKRLRMSFDELKRDQKEHDGDPLARSRRRALHRQIARGSLRNVKKAAFVVTNPTHIAIALEYRPPQVPIPRVLVRAADEAASRVRELAASYKIPMVENVPLARTLYATAHAGDVIPHETYITVAEVVASLAKAGALTL